MLKEDFYYDSRDGKHKIHAVRYVPDDGQVKCVVQIIHGMAEYIERYEEFAEYLTQRGFVVTGEDHLGHGKSIAEDDIPGYFCAQDPATVVVRDCHRLKKITQSLFSGRPYVIIGHSMGSFILRNYMFRYGNGIDGAIVMDTGGQSSALVTASKAMTNIEKRIRGAKHVSRTMNKLVFGNYNKGIENPRTEFDWLSRDTEAVDKYIADPLCGFVLTVNGFETLFELISRTQDKDNLSNIPLELPVYLLSGDMDPVGEYGEGVRRVEATLRDLGMENVLLKIYEGRRHELLNDMGKEEVMKDIVEWINENVLV